MGDRMSTNTQYYFKGEWRERSEIFNMLDKPLKKHGEFEFYGTCDGNRKTLAIVKYKGGYRLLSIRKGDIVRITEKGMDIFYDLEKGVIK